MFNQNTSQGKTNQNSGFVFIKRKANSRDISGDMTPDEIAEIVSEKMMDVVRQQFSDHDKKKK